MATNKKQILRTARQNPIQLISKKHLKMAKKKITFIKFRKQVSTSNSIYMKRRLQKHCATKAQLNLLARGLIFRGRGHNMN